MSSIRTKLAIVCAAGFLGVSTGKAAEDPTTLSEKVENLRTKVYVLLDKDVMTVKFGAGSADLSDGDKSSLRSLVTAAKAQKDFERFIVAAWSDREYPADRDAKLDKADRNLADKRKDNIKKAMLDAGATEVDSYSFAEHPSWVADVFNTEQAKLKGSGRIKDENDRVIAEIGKQLRDKGGPGTAVVVVKSKGDAAAH